MVISFPDVYVIILFSCCFTFVVTVFNERTRNSKCLITKQQYEQDVNCVTNDHQRFSSQFLHAGLLFVNAFCMVGSAFLQNTEYSVSN